LFLNRSVFSVATSITLAMVFGVNQHFFSHLVNDAFAKSVRAFSTEKRA